METIWTTDRMLQQNEDFLTKIWSLIILKDNYRSATDVFISLHHFQLINADDAITDAQIFRSEISVSLYI